MEGYPSGRRGLIANELVRSNLEREFESLTLRHKSTAKSLATSTEIYEGGARDYEVFSHPPPNLNGGTKMAKNLQPISWEGEEYIIKEHNYIWYLGLLVVGGGLITLAVFLKWWTFLILIVLCIITILISSLRPPRKIHYELNKDGLKEGQKIFGFDDYRAFGILKEESHFSAVLIPKKRFGLSVKVYFPGDSGEQIVDFLGARLPMEDVKQDFLDKIVNFLRI